ncbi:MAG: response regulator [Chitinophagaceae bacterium]|jgi:DNA-binding response OmpR family regulator|nr:response regulator [Chitinophagaceae bacterium]
MEKILVVNNDIDTMGLLKTWLERKKYKVIFTENKDDVRHIMRDFNPRVVLIDVLQGAVAEELKSDEQTRNVPILLMTGYTKNMQNTLSAADDVIEKPFNLDLLEKKIENLITR